MKAQHITLIAYLCLLGILLAGILFATGTISSKALNTAAIVLTVAWFALRLVPLKFKS